MFKFDKDKGVFIDENGTEKAPEEFLKMFSTVQAVRDERDKFQKESRETGEKLAELETKLKSFDDLDLEDYKKFKQSKKTDPEKLQEYEAKLSEYTQKMTDLEQKHKADLADKDAALENFRIEYALRDAFYSAGGKSGESGFGASYFSNVQTAIGKRIKMHEGKPTVMTADGDRPDSEYDSIQKFVEAAAKDAVLGVNFDAAKQPTGGGKGYDKNLTGIERWTAQRASSA